MATESGDKVAGNELKLYSFWISSCSFRVRMALNLKGLKYEYKAVNLRKGEQQDPEFLKINPLGFVPALVDGDIVIADSFAIIMYLDEKYPQHPLLPHDIQKRAINFQVANIVSSSIQPGQNMSQVKCFQGKISHDEKDLWIKNVIGKGFTALEKLLKDHPGKYATGDDFYLADLYLAPQIFAAITRFNIDMTDFPTLARLNEAYIQIPAFQDALPENEPDAPPRAH